MSKIPVMNLAGEPRGEWEVADELLVWDKGGPAVHAAVVAHRAAVRAGTASTLRKGEVAGSNKKPWRQKGTGRARAGNRRSPIWRGGGVAFGPKPRDYVLRLPKKAARLAFRRALSEKIAAGSVALVEDLTLPEPKTKHVADVVRRLQAERGVLIVVERVDPVLARAARNLPRVEVRTAADVSTYDVLRWPRLIATRGAMEALEGRLRMAAGRTA